MLVALLLRNIVSIPLALAGIAQIAIGIPRHQWDREELPRLMEAWEQSYQCMRCGIRFSPSMRT